MNSFQKIFKVSVAITFLVIFLDIIFSGFNLEMLLDIETWIIHFFYAFVLTAINASYFWWFGAKVKWEYANLKKVLFGAFGSVVLTLIGFFICRLLHHVVYEGVALQEFVANEKMRYYLFPLLFTTIVSLFFHLIYFYKALQEKKVKEQKIIAGTASAKFDALKNQLDPHFLFNSLNVLSALIEEDPSQAQKFTTSLSKVYRYVLEQKNKDLVSVDEELQFAKTYVKLLKMRFEDSIHLDIPDSCLNPEAKIVPLSLQLLLENAVKHNIVTSKKPLLIKVEEVNDTLVISNNLQEKQVVKKSTGVGLQNIRQRYNILTSREVGIEKTTSHFKVYLPMLSKKVSVVESQKSYIEDKRYEKAKERVESIKGFYGNLTAYLIVIPILMYVNYRTTSFTWFVFPALGWGFGLLGHGLQAFGYNPLFGRSWEERKIKEYMEDDSF